jgi:hypothetical protein
VSDSLELELRQLPGVSFVAFGERHGATLVELAASDDTDVDELRAEALRVVVGYLEGPVVIEVVDSPTAAADARAGRSGVRVQLILTLPGTAEGGAEVHLAHLDRRVAVHAGDGDRAWTAAAVLQGLAELGLAVPYAVDAIHALPTELGSGTLVALRDPLTGELRRGVATGRSPVEATARAVLSALNRYLQPAQL